MVAFTQEEKAYVQKLMSEALQEFSADKLTKDDADHIAKEFIKRNLQNNFITHKSINDIAKEIVSNIDFDKI